MDNNKKTGNSCPTCKSPVLKQDGKFLPLPPARIARIYAHREMKGSATASEINWLHDHLLLWLQGLRELKNAVQLHMSLKHAELKAMAPLSGLENPSRAYMKAKADYEPLKARRHLYQESLKERIVHVQSLIGPDPVNHVMAGHIVSVLQRIIDLSKVDDSASIEDIADNLIQKLTTKKGSK